ncbi:ABC transporter ATP-binding protein [Ideonella livida]|uniref:ATP-binding cassette domain-containing protein n=1 Tax=Ideonella livida TaxID=2707176 RepID=A0A7C9PK74_9BURK|nr:ATP-binding cassette domain-containing protein [Ideonella livida]NDY93034.1 ATP-binding cassette domain-containing protein [Ideonella livida]
MNTSCDADDRKLPAAGPTLSYVLQDWGPPGARPLEGVLHPGLQLVLGGEGRGKTRLLRLLAGADPLPAACTLHPAPWPAFLSDLEEEGLRAVVAAEWLGRHAAQPGWRAKVASALLEALGLQDHLLKQVHMLSTGTRRKLGLVAAAAGTARLVLLDQPHAALDARSCRVLDELLAEAAQESHRCWVVADYSCPERLQGLPGVRVLDLGD